MSSSDEGCNSPAGMSQNKYKGVRRRKWGKWVSEIRVPGTQDRLWLGSYTFPEAAAVARDIATYCLRGASSLDKLNFPLTLPPGAHAGMSPRSIQKVASDAGMAVDAQLRTWNTAHDAMSTADSGSQTWSMKDERYRDMDIVNCDHATCSSLVQEADEGRQNEALSISVEDYYVYM